MLVILCSVPYWSVLLRLFISWPTFSVLCLPFSLECCKLTADNFAQQSVTSRSQRCSLNRIVVVSPVTGHEINYSTVYSWLQLVYTRIINYRPCCNLYVAYAHMLYVVPHLHISRPTSKTRTRGFTDLANSTRTDELRWNAYQQW